MVFNSLYPDPPAVGDVNVHDFCFNRPEQAAWADYTCLVDQDGLSYTFKEFRHRVLQGATALSAELGLHPDKGEVVGIMSPNTLDYIALVHSCLALTIPFVLFSHASTQFELRHVWRSSNATRIFVSPGLLQSVLDVAKELGIDRANVHILGGKGLLGHSSFEDLMRKSEGKPLIRAFPATKSTLAYLITSSGTGGLPKCIQITHHNIIYNLLQGIVTVSETRKITGEFKWDTPEKIPVMIGFHALSHASPLNLCCFRLFLARSTYVIISEWDPIVVGRAIAKYRVTHVPLNPALAISLVSNPEVLGGADLSSLRVATSGAARMPPEIAHKIPKVLGQRIKLVEAYGLSEATFAAIVQPTANGILNGRVRKVPGSMGILLPGMKARILKEDGTEAEPNEIGELWLKGDNISPGYLNNPSRNKESFRDGWLRTGDLFYVDEDGNYFFVDRVKDTLKIADVTVSPLELEDVLRAHPDKLISDVAVAGIADGVSIDGQLPRAWVVLSQEGKKVGDQQVIQELCAWMEKNLSKYKWLRGGVEVVDQIPKSLNGKVLRRVLQEQYEKTHAQG